MGEGPKGIRGDEGIPGHKQIRERLSRGRWGGRMSGLFSVSTMDEDEIYAEAMRVLDDPGEPVPMPQPVSARRAWLGHILYTVGRKIMNWSQIVAWGRKDWDKPNE